MTLTQIDLWIGKTLFVPPIIKLCHLTRQSQFAVSRLFWFAAALDGLYRAETTMGQVIWGGLSIFMLLTAGRRADSPTASFMFFRLLALALLILELVKTAASGEWVRRARSRSALVSKRWLKRMIFCARPKAAWQRPRAGVG